MSNPSSSDIIFDRWKASLRSRDRTIKAVASNFDELFEELKKDGASFQEAYDILNKAIKAHLPNRTVVVNTYNKLKTNSRFVKTQSEFEHEWKDSIENAAKESFYAFFKPAKDDDDDGEPKVYGNMSAREYALQRRHADSFPVLDTSELERKLLENMYNSSEDLLNILDKKANGETN